MKMAKKVLSVLLAVVMALSCFGIAVSALGDPAIADHHASFTVKGAVGTGTFASSRSITIKDPTLPANGGVTPQSTISAVQGDVVYVYIYATADYFVHTLAGSIFYPAEFKDPNECLTSGTYSATNIAKAFHANANNRLFQAYGSKMVLANYMSMIAAANYNDTTKDWPYENGAVPAPFGNAAGQPDHTKWKFGRFSISVTETDSPGVMIDDVEGFAVQPNAEDDFIFTMALKIPDDCPDGTYQILIPEGSAAKADRRFGFTRITEMHESDSGELDGYICTESVVYDNNFMYNGDGSGYHQYFDFSNATLTVNVGNTAPETDYTALEALYNQVNGTDVSNATTETAATFETALAEAADILAAQTADQETVDAAAAALQSAFNGLAFKADYTALNAAIAAADEKVQSAYTSATWAPFAQSLAAAKAISPDLLEGDQGIIDAATNDLLAKTAALVPVTGANYSALNAAIATADAKVANESGWYTAATWSAMTSALEAAKAVPADLTSEQQGQIDTATTNLNTALAGLVEADADYSALNTALTTANAKVEADYTAASWVAFANAKSAAAAVPAGLKAKNQATIDTAVTNLNTAMGNLVPLAGADYTALDEAINTAPATEQANYTEATWSAYAAALTAAQNVARDLKETQQYIINAATQALTTAYNALRLKDADYSGVDEAAALVNTADAETIRIYTLESLLAFNAAVDAVVRGKTILEQDDVDAMEAAIRAAVANLQYKPATTTPLTEAIAAANAIDASLVESKDAVNEAVAAGNALLATELNITDNDAIAAAAQAILDAIDDLVWLGADYSALNEAKAAFEALDAADYTPATYGAAQTAYNAAVAVPANLGKADQETVDTAAENLNNAILALEEVDADYSALTAALTAAGKIKETSRKSSTEYIDNYTEATWDVFAAAKAAAEAVPAGLKKSSQSVITEAADTLTAAIAALEWAPFDYTETNDFLAQIDALDEMDYTAASWANLMTKKDALVMDYTMENFSKGMAQLAQLRTAKNNLVAAGPADYTAVNEAIAAAEALTAADWTAETWAVLEAALAAVETGLNENYQEQVNAMATAINDAIDGLEAFVAPVVPADYTALEAALAEAAALTAEDWTAETWAVLAAAVEAGQNVPADLTEDDQAIIDAAAQAITDAIAGLEEYVAPVVPADYTALQNALAAAAALNADDYTEATWATLANAVGAGQQVPADLTEDDQAIINAAAQAINNAIAGLVTKPVVATGSVTGIDYTPTTENSNTYQVTVSGRAMMVQFVELDQGNGTGTRSYDRYNEKVLSIQGYLADGTPCSSLDKNLAYEVWTITTPLAEGTIGVRVKNNGSSKWEAMDLALQFENVRVALDSGVVSAQLAKESGKSGAVAYTVVTGKDVKYIQFKNQDGETFTKSASKAVDNGDTYTFTGNVYFHGTGVRTATLRVLDDQGWHNTEVVLEYNINA